MKTKNFLIDLCLVGLLLLLINTFLNDYGVKKALFDKDIIEFENNVKQDKVIDIVKSEFERIAKEGPNQTYFEKSRANIIKSRTEMMQQNDYWLTAIDTYYSRNFDAHTDFDNIINSITAEDIKSFTKEFLDQGNEIEVIMYPAVD